jgi:hypothetical protein
MAGASPFFSRRGTDLRPPKGYGQSGCMARYGPPPPSPRLREARMRVRGVQAWLSHLADHKWALKGR